MNREYPKYRIFITNGRGFQPEESYAQSVHQCKKWALSRYNKGYKVGMVVHKRITLKNGIYEYVQCRVNKEI